MESVILEKIEDIRDEIIKFQQNIIQIRSENPLGKYIEIAKFTDAKMKEIGLNSQIKRNNVFGEIGKGNGKSLIFNAHYDTVEVFDGWTINPFGAEIIDGKI